MTPHASVQLQCYSMKSGLRWQSLTHLHARADPYSKRLTHTPH